MGAPISWIISLVLMSFALVRGYDDGSLDGWYQPVPHRPVDIITDVINDLGVRILQQYTSHGNVAFSPTGVGFVLAALYEGSAGRSRQQISDALGLPRDSDITRIGFRDVHRRLRTYLNADGFLGGLTLNEEYTKLRPEYEDILRFYGFDLSISDEANETTTAPETTMPEMTVITTQPMTETGPSDETTVTVSEGTTATIQSMQSETTTEAAITTTPAVELLDTTLNTIDAQSRLTQVTSDNTKETPMFNTMLSQTMVSSTEQISTITETATVPSVPEEMSTTVRPVQSTTTVTSTLQSSSTNRETTATSSTTIDSLNFIESESSTLMEASESITSTSVPNSAGTEPSSESMTTLLAEETTTITPAQVSITTVLMNLTESRSSTISDKAIGSTNGPPVDENTVSTVSIEMGSTDLPATTIDTGETGSNLETTTVSFNTNDTTNRIRKRSVRSPRGYFTSYPDEGIWMQDLGIWKPYSSSLSEASVRDSTEISFLVNGCDVTSVTASRYFAVLPFAHFPSLHAVALEFPLDDPRYNILLLMATDRRDTYRLARDLGGKSLRLLRKQLQATWVRATIPSFMLRGFVTLTSFLQRLGILDVFEPRSADLSPMTPDLGVYARDVQQSIGVNIRNYMKPDRTHSRESPKSDPPLIVPPRRDYYRYYHPGNGLFERAGPVPFTIVQPFLYFIVDAETSVVLIAGRVNDPLNSRIL